MAINRANIAKELLPGLNAVFGLEYNDVSAEHTVLFDIEKSDRAFEEEVLRFNLMMHVRVIPHVTRMKPLLLPLL